ncbi:MAG: prephenate dehydrogenase [Candidatus Altiarchaeota archaeon]
MAVQVAVVGGYGGMGRILALLFKSEGCSVVIAGPTESKGRAAALELGAQYVKDNVKAVKGADVVVITVPIAATKDTILQVAPHVKPGGLLMDLTSVKEWPCELMAKHAGRDVEVCGTHPVFGPRVGSVEGQIFVLTPVRGTKRVQWLRDILVRHDARVIESSPKEHDEVMAVVQGLTHFTYISVGKTLLDIGFDVRQSRQFSSPIYDLMLDMVGRIIGQDPYLYAEIQMQNPKVLDAHAAYLKAASEISAMVREKRESEFVTMMAQAAKHFGDTERSMGRSDKAIGSLVAELKALKGSVGREICLRHMYSGVVHFGVVESVSAEEVVLRDGGKSTALKLSNLIVLGDRERTAYKRQKYGTTMKDYSAVLSESADESFIAELLARNAEAVVGASVRDVYTGQKIGPGMKSVCFSVELIKDDVKANDARVAEFLRKIGGALR